MARLTEAEQVLLRSVLYLLKDSQQRDQAELPSASEAPGVGDPREHSARRWATGRYTQVACALIIGVCRHKSSVAQVASRD